MYAKVRTPQKRLAEYKAIIGDHGIADLRALALPLKEARVLHLTVTAFGGGAPEELMALVPLMNDLGLNAEWQVVRGSGEYARVIKAVGNALGGVKVRSVESVLDTWERYNTMNAALFDGDYDFVVVHDPHPAGIKRAMEMAAGKRALGRWIWHCHVDLASTQAAVWNRLRSYLDCCYDAAIFAAPEYLRRDLGIPLTAMIAPAIDPLNTKNMHVDPVTQRRVTERYGIDPRRPMICQEARFVRWGDPIGVIDGYRLAKREVADLQLVLVWAMPVADAQSWRHYQRVASHAGSDPDIHLLSNLNEVGNLEQNVFQRLAGVVVHRSLRKGFAAPVAEASWKCRPVVVGRTGVMPGQVIDGLTGYVVDSIEEIANRVVGLLKDPSLADQMGKAGHDHVRDNFLITRCLRDYLELFDLMQAGHSLATGT